MPPRLCGEQDWDDEKSESWEDEDMWSQVVDADDAEMATPTTSDLRGGPKPERYGGFVQQPVSPPFTPGVAPAAGNEENSPLPCVFCSDVAGMMTRRQDSRLGLIKNQRPGYS